MSIATAITAVQGKVADAYTAVSSKGGTLPVTQNLSNLPTAINSIPSGSSSENVQVKQEWQPKFIMTGKTIAFKLEKKVGDTYTTVSLPTPTMTSQPSYISIESGEYRLSVSVWEYEDQTEISLAQHRYFWFTTS